MVAGDSAWVRRFHAAPQAPVRLVCFPHAGGAASYFFPMARALAPAIEVLSLQYPGRQDRRSERCLESVAELAQGAAAALAPWQDRPLAFFGHSLGATVAFEAARLLDGQGAAPLGLFASGRRAPSRLRTESLHTVPDDRLLAEVAALDGTRAGVLDEPDMVRMVLPPLRADYRAVETYRCAAGASVSCPVVVLSGRDDPLTTPDEARAWREHTDAGCEVEFHPGGHFFLGQHPAGVLASVRAHLDRWLTRGRADREAAGGAERRARA